MVIKIQSKSVTSDKISILFAPDRSFNLGRHPDNRMRAAGILLIPFDQNNDVLKFSPGVNPDIAIEDWDKVKNSQLIETRIQSGEIAVIAQKPLDDPSDPLSIYQDADALIAVRHEYNINTLEAWARGAKSKVVRTAIEKRINQLKAELGVN